MGGEALGFEVEAVVAGGLEPGGEGGWGEVGAGVVVGVAEGVGGGVDVFVGVAGVVLEEGLEGDLDEAGDVGAGEVDEVEADVGIVGVVAVAVMVPVGGVDVDFEVAAEAAGWGADGEFGVEEVGAGFVVPVAGVVELDGLVVGGAEVFGALAVVGPEALYVAFGEGGGSGFVEGEGVGGWVVVDGVILIRVGHRLCIF